MFSNLDNQENVTDIINKSSVKGFFITEVAKKNSSYMICKKSTDQLYNVLEEILLDLHRHVAKLALL